MLSQQRSLDRDDPELLEIHEETAAKGEAAGRGRRDSHTSVRYRPETPRTVTPVRFTPTPRLPNKGVKSPEPKLDKSLKSPEPQQSLKSPTPSLSQGLMSPESAEAEARVSTSEAAAESSVFCSAFTCLVELQTYVREDFTIKEKAQ